MANERHGVATYGSTYGENTLPGVEYATYTCSHGISPGVAVVRVNVEPDVTALPAEGTLVITDGEGEVVLPGCKVDQVVELRDGEGVRWEVRLRDRRWRWLEFGSIRGSYNQLDPHAKLIGWMAQDPTALARLCLDAMEEEDYEIDMPPGLSKDDGAEDFLPAGQNYPPTGTNPPIDWGSVPPAQALQQLCDLFGRRVVYRVDTDRVAVVRPGIGAQLPSGSLFRYSPSLKASALPEEVAIVGAPTRFQGRFLLQAVGQDWDESWKPINALSYAPRASADSPQTTKVTIRRAGSGQTYQLTINGLTLSFTAAGTSALDVANGLNAALTGALAANNPAVKGVIKEAAVSGDATAATLTLTGYLGKPFYADGSVSGGSPTGSVEVRDTAQAAKKGEPDWSHCPPPTFPGIREPANGRLTKQQARALAQKTVWKCYQLVNLDVSGVGPIHVPGFGEVKRRQQILLLPTQVDQIRPADVDKDFRDRAGEALVLHHYNGYSRDKPAQVFGSVCKFLLDATYVRDQSVNTKPTDPVLVGFTIDPTFQIVQFNSHVYALDAGDNHGTWQADKLDAKPKNAEAVIHRGRIVEPRLVLQTSCNVRDEENNQFVCFTLRSEDPDPDLEQMLPVPAGGASQGLDEPLGLTVLAQHRPDVQLEVTSTYSADGMTLENVEPLDLDAKYRAQHYLEGLARSLPPSDAQVAGYNGIVAVAFDGAISQATWEVGGEGATTVVSRNTEHHEWYPPYPARRRAELLRAAGPILAIRPGDVNPGVPPGR